MQIKFFLKHFFSMFEQILLSDLFTFTKEILKEKLHFSAL